MSTWMWSEALSMLDRAERLQRQFFHHAAASWEPPVDVIETADEVHVHVALPGVAAASIRVALDPAGLSVSASRAFPCAGEAQNVHRIEIPYGRFERQIGRHREIDRHRAGCDLLAGEVLLHLRDAIRPR